MREEEKEKGRRGVVETLKIRGRERERKMDRGLGKLEGKKEEKKQWS